MAEGTHTKVLDEVVKNLRRDVNAITAALSKHGALLNEVLSHISQRPGKNMEDSGSSSGLLVVTDLVRLAATNRRRSLSLASPERWITQASCYLISILSQIMIA
ncbi:hypothetical protein Hanom_Chr12g01106911 [Helianthus anomalus]